MTSRNVTDQDAPALPELFLLVDQADTDVAGTLYDAAGFAMWSHVSSTLMWLKHDIALTPHRQTELKKRYPQGCTVTTIEPADTDGYERLVALWDTNQPGWRTTAEETQ